MLLYLLELYGLYQQGDYSSRRRRVASRPWQALFSTIVLFFSGWTFLRGAWRAAVARTVTMDTLIALGTLFAYGDSLVMTVTASGPAYFDAVVMVTQIVVLGRYLEMAGGARARKDLHRLLALQPERARVRRADAWEDVRVRPGAARRDDPRAAGGTRAPRCHRRGRRRGRRRIPAHGRGRPRLQDAGRRRVRRHGARRRRSDLPRDGADERVAPGTDHSSRRADPLGQAPHPTPGRQGIRLVHRRHPGGRGGHRAGLAQPR